MTHYYIVIIASCNSLPSVYVCCLVVKLCVEDIIRHHIMLLAIYFMAKSRQLKFFLPQNDDYVVDEIKISYFV